MPKNAYFLEKSYKIATASKASPSNPHWPPAAGGSAPNSQRCYSSAPPTDVTLSKCVSIVKRTIFYYRYFD